MGILETIGAALAAILGAIGWGWFQRRKWRDEGKQEAYRDAERDAIKRQQAAREAVARGRASGDDPDKRVQSNDAAWR